MRIVAKNAKILDCVSLSKPQGGHSVVIAILDFPVGYMNTTRKNNVKTLVDHKKMGPTIDFLKY